MGVGMAMIDFSTTDGGLRQSLDRVKGLMLRGRFSHPVRQTPQEVLRERKRAPYAQILESELRELQDLARVRASLYASD
jgi:hypothetical protein